VTKNTNRLITSANISAADIVAVSRVFTTTNLDEG